MPFKSASSHAMLRHVGIRHTYDMLKMALKYHAAIDDVTGNKSLKLRKYGLDDDDWQIISDLIRVLKDRVHNQ